MLHCYSFYRFSYGFYCLLREEQIGGKNTPLPPLLTTNTHTRTTKVIDIIFEDFLTLYQNLLSPQVKQSVIISNKHVIYELLHQLPNDLT